MKGRVSLHRKASPLDRVLGNKPGSAVSAVFGGATFLGDALTVLLLRLCDDAQFAKAVNWKLFLVWWSDRVRIGGRWKRRCCQRDCLAMMATPLAQFHSFTTGIHITMVDEMDTIDRLRWQSARDNMVRLLAWNQHCDTPLYLRLTRCLAPVIYESVGIGTYYARDFKHWAMLDAMHWEEWALESVARDERGSACMQFHWFHWGRVYTTLCLGGRDPQCILVTDVMQRVAALFLSFHTQ